MFKTGDTINFTKLFLVPAGVALAAAVFLFLTFRPPLKPDTATGAHG
jgi:hypothetical protein